MLNILGVDLVDTEGNVVASDYHYGSAGGTLYLNVYTLEGLTADAVLTLRSFVYDNAVEETNSTHAILAEKADIPANEGAILAGNGTAKLNIINAATTDWTNNKLEGTTIDSYIEGSAYILSKSKKSLYRAALNKDASGADGTTHFKNNANKAYMPISDANESNFYGLRLPGTTAVENVTVENGVKTIFDLTGRRIENITVPGIYIVNGVKVLVK